MQQPQEPTSPTHNEDLIKYIHESWNKVSKEFEHFSQNGSETTKQGVVPVQYFDDQDTNPQLKDFEPFDLDGWWGKRLVQNIQRNEAS